MGRRHTDCAGGVCSLQVPKLRGGFVLLLHYVTYVYTLHKLFCMYMLFVLRMKIKFINVTCFSKSSSILGLNVL